VFQRKKEGAEGGLQVGPGAVEALPARCGRAAQLDEHSDEKSRGIVSILALIQQINFADAAGYFSVALGYSSPFL